MEVLQGEVVVERIPAAKKAGDLAREYLETEKCCAGDAGYDDYSSLEGVLDAGEIVCTIIVANDRLCTL